MRITSLDRLSRLVGAATAILAVALVGFNGIRW
jgi:hypothetical protein